MDISAFIPEIDLIYPEVFLALWSFFLLCAGIFLSKKDYNVISVTTLIGLVATAIILVLNFNNYGTTFSDAFIADGFSNFFKVLFIIAGILTVLMSGKYNAIEGIVKGEYYVLICFSILGMFIISSGNDLMVIYIGIELMALSIYALVGFKKRDIRSNEAALKYFVLGAFSSGILLYGISLLYGETSSTNILEVQTALLQNGFSRLSILGIVLIIVGLAFKIAAVPFHLWCPDAYDGAPTAITAFMSVAPKAAGFAAFLRIFTIAVIPAKDKWFILLWLLSAFTMIIGNVLAVAQDNVKRLLAYSSIAHAGYALMGIVAAGKLVQVADGRVIFSEEGRLAVYAVLFYMLAYTFMNLGAFTVVIFLRNNSLRGDRIADFSGLARIKPFYAAAMGIFLLSLMGIPPMAGFVGKFYIFGAAIKAKLYYLAVIGILTSAVSVYYYFKIIKAMYIDKPSERFSLLVSKPLALVLVVSMIMTLLIGLYPGPFLNLARESFFIFM
ncbi:MAG: NADH-quinone oxidoreductase subunit N [Candidatus Schekmanbacteria bacterium]|nr:MAG: NADH-quinone oxidoreductase subunit N [Candidatus Schekmanbacteria bacterium]